MTADNINKIKVIVTELLNEFNKDRASVQDEYDKISRRITELEENINNYGDNIDADFDVFSPLNISKSNDKIDNYNKEKNDIEEKSIRLSKKLRYYNTKCESLNEVLNIINGENIKTDEYDDVSRFFNVKLKDDGLSKYEKKVKEQEEERVYTSINESQKEDPFESIIKKNQFRNSLNETNNQNEYKENIQEPGQQENNIVEIRRPDNEQRVSNLESANNNVNLGLSEINKNSVIEDLKRVSHRIELGYKIIDQDTRRTKMELKSIKSSLDDVIKIIE